MDASAHATSTLRGSQAARAEAVCKWLTDMGGVSLSRIRTEGDNGTASQPSRRAAWNETPTRAAKHEQSLKTRCGWGAVGGAGQWTPSCMYGRSMWRW